MVEVMMAGDVVVRDGGRPGGGGGFVRLAIERYIVPMGL